jgi:hypothetical protein
MDHLSLSREATEASTSGGPVLLHCLTDSQKEYPLFWPKRVRILRRAPPLQCKTELSVQIGREHDIRLVYSPQGGSLEPVQSAPHWVLHSGRIGLTALFELSTSRD